jgi:hypothetical protein
VNKGLRAPIAVQVDLLREVMDGARDVAEDLVQLLRQLRRGSVLLRRCGAADENGQRKRSSERAQVQPCTATACQVGHIRVRDDS